MLHYVREFMCEFMTWMFTLPGRDPGEEEKGAACWWRGAETSGLCVSSVWSLLSDRLWTVVERRAQSCESDFPPPLVFGDHERARFRWLAGARLTPPSSLKKNPPPARTRGASVSRLGRELSTEDASLLPRETEVCRCELRRAETVVTATSEGFISCGLVWLTTPTRESTGVTGFHHELQLKRANESR